MTDVQVLPRPFPDSGLEIQLDIDRELGLLSTWEIAPGDRDRQPLAERLPMPPPPCVFHGSWVFTADAELWTFLVYRDGEPVHTTTWSDGPHHLRRGDTFVLTLTLKVEL